MNEPGLVSLSFSDLFSGTAEPKRVFAGRRSSKLVLDLTESVIIPCRLSKMMTISTSHEKSSVAPPSQYDWTGWTEWTLLHSLDMNTVPATPGAYVLSASRPIDRAVGTDDMGILDIGESGEGNASLRLRIGQLRRCVNKRLTTGHMAGWRFAYFRFERHFPLISLRIRWTQAKEKKEAYQREGLVMLTYLARHGELPPLNYKFNWSACESDLFAD